MTEHKKFGRYETEKVLGRGGMGTVYLAHDPLIGRAVAIKEIRLDGSLSAEQRQEIEARFEQEFRAAGNLSHPNVVTIYDVGTGDGSYFIAMEYIDGATLEERLASGRRLTTDQVLDLGRQMAAGLDYAHGQGVIHRDVKPANILFADRTQAKITDFGVAKLRSADLTQTGRLIGTPAFMAPEQILGQAVDGRADQFSLAVILYLMLTGSKPFAGEHKSTVLYQIVHEEPRPPQLENSDLPAAVDAVLLQALAKSPNQRFPSCRNFVDALRKALCAERRLPGRASSPSQEATSQEATSQEATSQERGLSKVAGATPTDTARPTAASSATSDTIALTGDTVLTRAGRGDEPLEFSAANEPQVIADRARATRSRSSAKGYWIAALVLLAMAAAGYWLLGPRGLLPSTEPDPTASGAANAEPSAAAISNPAEIPKLPVVSEIEGAEIWRDGVDTGLRTPATVEFEAAGNSAAGSSVELEVKHEGRTIAQQSFDLAEPLPPAWNASPPRTRTLTILSKPAGAQIEVDGQPSGSTTPAELEFERHRRYRLDLSREGYQPASWSFELDDLDARQDASGELSFPLREVIPPAVVSIEAGFPVAVRSAGRNWKAAERHRLELAPGDYRLELVAEEFFFRQTYQMALGSGDREELQVPEAFAVKIIASPANCQVSIDGQVVDFTPILDRRIAAGQHELLFEWPTLGRSKRLTVEISEPQQRIFMTSD